MDPRPAAVRRTPRVATWRRALVALALCSACVGEEAEDALFLGDSARTVPPSTQRAAPAPAKPAPAKTSAPQPQPEEWPPGIIESLSLQSERASEAFFNLIEDVEVAAIKAGRGVVNARIGRRVFDNHDVLGSWTVVDHVRLDGNYPLYSFAWPIVGPLQGGWAITGDIANEFLDIRQVLPRDFARLPSLEQRARDLQNMGRQGQEEDRTALEQEWTKPFAGLEQARWGRLWNIILFPGRAPLGPDWVAHLQQDEVMTMLAEGTIQIGPQLLWQVPIPHVVTTLNAQVSVATYLYGQFRLSILKESNRYVRLRVTRVGEAGLTGSAGGFSSDVVPGFQVYHWNLFHNKTQITPFTFTIRHGKGRSFDLVYRYDLASPAGRRAYAHAIQGRFALSDELAGGSAWRVQRADAPVRRLADRKTVYVRGYKGSSARYGLIYRHSHESTLTSSEVTADFPESSARVFRSEADNNRSWRFVWGTYASYGYHFRIDLDRDRADHHLPDAATLQVRAEITDSDTTGDDLYAYMDEAEIATGRHGFFPRPPRLRPTSDTPHFQDTSYDRRGPDRHERPISYGRASFFYQLTFSQDQIERFVHFPQVDHWSALEHAFGVPKGAWATAPRRLAWDVAHLPERILNIPLYALDVHYRQGSMLEHARAMEEAWGKADVQGSLESQMEALGEMFSDRRYSDVLVRLLRDCLPGQSVSYVIQGSSHGFGYLRDEGAGTTPIDPLPEQKQLVIDFDRLAARAQGDPKASLAELRLEPLGDGRFRLTFRTASGLTPRDLYLALLEIRPWRLPREVGQAAYIDTKHTLASGRNVLVLSSRDGPFADLLARIEPGNVYVLHAAYSRDGHTWGPIAETRLTMPLLPSSGP